VLVWCVCMCVTLTGSAVEFVHFTVILSPHFWVGVRWSQENSFLPEAGNGVVQGKIWFFCRSAENLNV
jgi:hypothetical protein